MPQEKSTTANTSKQSRKVKMPGIFLEREFMRGRRAKTLRELFGADALPALQVIWLDLADSSNGSFSQIEATISAAEYLQRDSIPAFLTFCVSESLLDQVDGRYLAPRINTQKEKRLAERERKTSGKSPEKVCTAVLSLKSKVLDQKEEPPEPQTEDPETAAIIAAHFQPEGDWQRSSAYMNCGRRPLRKYPEIWMTPVELQQTLELYKTGLDQKYWRRCFLAVQKKARDQLTNGGEPSRLNTSTWLTSWAYTDTVSQVNEEARLRRTTGADNTRPRPKPLPKSAAPPRTRTPEEREEIKRILEQNLNEAEEKAA